MGFSILRIGDRVRDLLGAVIIGCSCRIVPPQTRIEARPDEAAGSVLIRVRIKTLDIKKFLLH
jgi:hypothetical protein